VALLSSQPLPSDPTDYEVNANLGITGSSNGAFVLYLRATAGSLLRGGYGGSYNAPYLTNISCTGQAPSLACTGLLYLYQSTNGQLTLSSYTKVPLHNGSTFRGVVHGTEGAIYIDNVLYMFYSAISPTGTTGPGIGVNGSTNGITSVSLGAIDSVVPNPVNADLVQTSLQSNQVTLHWTPVLDNQGGIGVAYYDIYRNSVWISHAPTPNFVDTGLSPSTTYTYWIVPVDFHLNAITTVITATTAPSSAIDGRQTGVRTTGTYWGGGGEQIDMRSGNLNFTQPLIKPMGRGGWGVPFNLSYNSQNWRLAAGGVNWLVGGDTGYGFGWKLQAGSLTPVNSSYFTVGEYIFTDSTGAQYVLNQNSSGVWSSTDSIYVWYDTTASPPRLHFPDGSFWEFGCQSAGTEEDGGTLYPTVMEDSNGNQITVVYNAGLSLPATSTNSSARISTISDVRTSPTTYQFSYTQDFIPHLFKIANLVGTAENYTLTVLYGQALDTPTGATFYGTTNVLESVTQDTTQLTTSFAYDQYGSTPPYATSGALTQVTFPLGGYLSWTYKNIVLTDETLPEVSTRSWFASGSTSYPSH
jgi:hypothetical protein